MTKKHWRESGLRPLIARLEERLATPYQCADGQLSWCESWSRVSEQAFAAGFDTSPPPTTATEQIAQLRAERDFETLNERYRIEGLNFEADREARALVRWNSLRRWAAEPSNEERRAEELARAQADQREAEIESRALAIVAEQNRAALERARVQARKELAR